MKHHARTLLLTLCLVAQPALFHADDTVEIHGILEETTAGVILVTDASSYIIRGIDASGLDGRRAIVLGDQGEDNGLEYIDATEIKIAQ
ncbi:MAG: hypothetical protein EOL86_05630 [Deltaproteobacteria bacterium]|nr:hypothetical protein [Deltaproteobacteria bacterium]